MDPYLRNNLDRWNELTPIHETSEFYDLAGFKAGKSTLKRVELEELGDVSGKSLLHLQCHFGLDTLSWARRGAVVTGVDFADRAIALAQSLSREAGLDARFICSDVYDLPRVLAGQYDIVFTSYGVLYCLPDLPRWAAVVAHYLKPGGTFYIAEFHPFTNVFDTAKGATDLRVVHSYFHRSEPARWHPSGSYADRSAAVATPSYEWTHSLGDLINALIVAGLRIEFLHEFPFCVEPLLPCLEPGGDGLWRWKDREELIPLVFSLMATK